MSDKIISRLSTTQKDFDSTLDKLLSWDSVSNENVSNVVNDILARVKSDGDAALLELTNRFDRRQAKSVQEFIVSQYQLQNALSSISKEGHDALIFAADRIREYHSHQLQSSWRYTESDGNILGQQITPIEKVGVYVPGGKASYPSSVLMNTIPAKVAGVSDITMVVPAPDGLISPMVLAAASIAGVDRIITVGGAQAIAALAFGTESVPKVDKIVGPGNIYVASAKRAVFGQVAIDMIAGPSEILIICDGKTDPDWIAMDLFSQAEHDEQAQSILVCPDNNYLDEVEASIKRLLPTLARESIARISLKNRGALIKVTDLTEAIKVSNRIAPEHLELSVSDPEGLLPLVRHAGAIFMGRFTPEALGDYCAGPNHVLPTSGTARFSSPLGVYDFQKRSSIIHCSPDGASKLSKIAETLANSEDLEAHARSAAFRII